MVDDLLRTHSQDSVSLELLLEPEQIACTSADEISEIIDELESTTTANEDDVCTAETNSGISAGIQCNLKLKCSVSVSVLWCTPDPWPLEPGYLMVIMVCKEGEHILDKMAVIKP